MTDQNPDIHPEQQEPLIPPQYLLIVAGVAFLVAIISAFTQPEFGVVGYGALALTVLSLLAWAFMAPDQARAAFSGRTARYGGLSFLVTVLVLVALIVIYVLVRNANLRADLTQRDQYSLSAESKDAIQKLGADPTIPKMKMVAFYSSQQSGNRDRDTVLFDDYVANSNGKLSYEFVDPDRSPQVAQQYGINSNGSIAVVPLDENDQPVIAEAETVTFLSQDELTNAILKVSASGDFRVYVMNVEGGITTAGSDAGSMSVLTGYLQDQFDWTVKDISFLDVLRGNSEINLNDPNVDGQSLMIVGGTKPLSEQEITVLQDYVDNGGDLVIFAENSFNDDQTSLATGPAVSDFLYNNFGFRFRNDVVVDQAQYFQNPLFVIAADFDPSHWITSNLPPQSATIFSAAHSIELAETAPTNVTVTPLVRSSDQSYGKTELDQVLDSNLDKTDADPQGPLVLGAVAENSQTGARVVLFGSTALVQDNLVALQQQGVVNLSLSLNTLVWETNFNDFYQRTTIVSQQRPQDVPIVVDAPTLRTANFITIVVLPFGILAIGLLVWWNGRERERTSH